jgi:hypothetical protein
MRRVLRRILLGLTPLAFAAAAQPLPSPGGHIFFHPGYVVGYWYLPGLVGAIATSSWLNPIANRVTCSPGSISQTITVASVAGYVATASAGGNVQWAIYNSGSWGRPSTLAVATSSISTATTGVLTGAVSKQLSPGNYWWCQNIDNATAIVVTYSPIVQLPQGIVGSSVASTVITASAAVSGVYTAQTFGTWPSFTSGTTWVDSGPYTVPSIGFQVGSVP